MDNVERYTNYTQVCVWPATTVGKDKVEQAQFERWFLDEYGAKIQYLEEIETFPDLDKDGNPVEGTGNRNDIFFAVHENDIGKFAIPKLNLGARWIEDVLADCNYHQKIYPERVFQYKCWDADTGDLSSQGITVKSTGGPGYIETIKKDKK